MAATLIRQTIREESPIILQAATEAAITSTSSTSLAIGSMAANAARTAAVASVEAATTVTTTSILGGAGKMGVEVISKEAGALAGESSILSSRLAVVRQTATHSPLPSVTNAALPETAALSHAIPQPTITTATGTLNPNTLTSSIARQALSKPITPSGAAGRNGSTLARMDLNVAQTAETIKEAISNAVQEGLEEQMDKAMDMHKVTVAATSVGTISGPEVIAKSASVV